MDSELSRLFRHLHDGGIPYFLLTDFEGDFNSKDVDVFVYPNQQHAFETALSALGWYRRKEPTFHVNHNFYYSPKTEVYLDVKYALTFAKEPNICCTYLGFSEAATKAVLNNHGIYRPQGFDAILLYAAHLAYKERGKLEAKHEAYLSQYITLYKAGIEEAQQDVVTQIEQWLLLRFPEDTSRLQEILAPYFKTENRKMTRPAGFKYGYGLNVLFLGTDGSGKTTLVEAVGNKLNIKNNRLYLGAGESSWSSPAMKQIYNYRFKTKVIDRLYGLIRTFVVLPLEYSFRIAPVIHKSKYNITLIDRFPGFVFLDSKPGRALLYKSILPTPDLVFFLYAAPEVLVKRKPDETNIQRSKQDIEKFEKVAHIVSNGNYKRIDTSELTIDEARDLIITEIYNHPKLYKTLLTTASCN